MGHWKTAPIDHRARAEGRPTALRLEQEERASLLKVHDRAGTGPAERDYALGVVRALPWLLGHTGDHP
ncbi:hypothetical protein [Kitasatospora terrestris]|uniref:Transposase n=1 Tax=Kitasatospora terrestris TaxID=258051 RepID=A0ABP9DD90_9ACTN